MADSKEDYKNMLLDPDHPLLEPFQRALKEHLLNQIARLKDELDVIESDAKRKDGEMVEIGVRAYEAQQQVCLQQKTLETLIQDINTLTAVQEKEETDLENNMKELKSLQNKLYQTEKSNREMMSEIESLNALNLQLSNSETKIESHININKRIADKTRQDNQKLAEEKRRQDYLIHQLLSEVWKFENEIETCKLQLSVKEEELEELEQKIAIGNTNTSALEAELRGLLYSWNTVVVAVSNRDKGLDCLINELSKLEETHKTIQSETDQAKKLIKKEQLEHEKYTVLKERIELDIKSSQNQLEEQMIEKQKLENKFYEIQCHMEQAEKDVKNCQMDCHRTQHSLLTVSEVYEKLVEKKQSIQQEILACIESEIANDQVGKKAKRTLKEITDKKRKLEVILSEVENKKSMLHSENESQKFKIEELNRINKETKDQMNELDELRKKLKSENEKYELVYRTREKQVLILNQKLEEKMGIADLDKVTRAELRIAELTKLIDESQQNIKNLQVFWMREQKNILGVSNERQEQIHNISLLKKQVLILEQKNLRITDEIAELRNREEKTVQHINILTNKATMLCDNVYKKRTKKTSLDRNNALLQGEYEMKLKDAELHLLQIESEIAEIEDEKLSLSKELIELNREGLEWEKKFQMTKEAVTNLRDSVKRNGEMATMRTEVHKMEVIYGELKRAQTKLVRDMEQCISRRDTLYYKSESNQHTGKTKKMDDRLRINFQKKLDNLKNQIKQARNELEAKKKKCPSIINHIAKVNKDIEKIYRAPVFNKNYKNNLKNNLEETKINRQFKFELLVFQQRKAHMYSLIVNNKKPYTIYKKEEHLINEYQKEKDINNKLIKIIEYLRSDYPARENELIKIRNTLEIVALCMYT